MLAQKTSISIEGMIWEEIKDLKNKSGFINQALRFFLDRQKIVEDAEKKYWENVEKSLLNNNGEYFSLNQNGEKITKEVLEAKLWK